MKRRISAILLCLALLVGLLPTTALAAVTDSWDLKVHVSENDKVKYGEKNTLEVGFGVQSDNLQLRNLQSVMVAVDLTVFDLISKSGKVMTDKEFGDLKTTEYTEGAGKYVYFGNKFYSENAEEDVNWTTKVYFAKSEVGKIGYVKIEPAQGQDACSVTTEMILSSVLLGFKAGKSKADLKPDSIRIATLEEANKLSNEVVAILTDGNENTQYYGFNPASGYTALKNNPAVVWADGLLPGTTYTVSFNANGGSGEMTPVSGVSGSYTLPENGFTAPEGKQFKGWARSADGEVLTAPIEVTADITLYAIWEDIPAVTYTVSFDANGGSGSMADETGISGTYTLPACTFTAPAGKQFKGWATSASGAVIAGTSIEVTANTTLYAVWEDIPAVTYTVSFDANGGSGSMADVTEVSGTYTLPACTFTAPAGKQFKGWAASASGAVIAGTSIEVTANTTLYAVWEDIPAVTYTVSFDANGGSGSMADVTGISGTYTLPACTFTAPTGKQFKGWATSASGAVIAGTTIEVTANTTLYAIWRNISSGGTGSGGGVTTYSITVKDAKNGDVTASHKSAAKGALVTLTVDPDKGYVLDTLTVLDGKDKEIKLTEKNGKYTFTMPASKVTVEAMFKASAPTGKNPFIDVPAGSYYEDAVIWAVEKGITSGTSAVTFDPNGNCTRAQAVTFLWRAAGSPAPKTKVMPFTDVPSGSYYYDAVLWAMEQGITKGTSDTAFSPNASCTRAQIVTFLWRANGSPAVSGNSAFTDVASDAYYAAAVAWAEKNGVTGGIGNGLFGSGNNCTRAQIVTFLYRAMK